MPHMAPFMWSMAPVLIMLSAYFIYVMLPTPIMFIPPIMPQYTSLSWDWQ